MVLYRMELTQEEYEALKLAVNHAYTYGSLHGWGRVRQVNLSITARLKALLHKVESLTPETWRE